MNSDNPDSPAPAAILWSGAYGAGVLEAQGDPEDREPCGAGGLWNGKPVSGNIGYWLMNLLIFHKPYVPAPQAPAPQAPAPQAPAPQAPAPQAPAPQALAPNPMD
ncbi:hypothetical protein Tco_0010575 [Tanacetum coccineum]